MTSSLPIPGASPRVGKSKYGGGKQEMFIHFLDDFGRKVDGFVRTHSPFLNNTLYIQLFIALVAVVLARL